MSFASGKAPLCDGSNISSSRAYINNALVTRGLLRNNDAELKFNSADAPDVMNLIYDMMRKYEQDERDKEKLSAKLREMSSENDRLLAAEKQHISRAITLQKEIGVLKNQLGHAKDDVSIAKQEMKELRDNLTKTTVALNHTKTQTSNELRKRDAQIVRMKEHLADGGTVRRSKVSSSMTIRKCSAIQNSGPPTFASYVAYDPSLQASLTQESNDQLARMARVVSEENDQLAELVQATLSSLDTLVQIEEDEHPLFSSTSQSIIVLEAQLKVRLTALRNILDMPNYVPIEQVELRDAKIRDLQKSLLQIETEWHSAQSVLKGLTASVLQDAEKGSLDSKGIPVLGEWSDGSKNIEPEPAYANPIAKTPVAISLENKRQPHSTVKIDARLLRVEQANCIVDPSTPIDSTPIRARKQKTQRRHRRATLGLVASEEDLHAELQGVLEDNPE